MQGYDEIIQDCGALVAAKLKNGEVGLASSISAAMTYILRRVFEEKPAEKIQDEIIAVAKKLLHEDRQKRL